MLKMCPLMCRGGVAKSQPCVLPCGQWAALSAGTPPMESFLPSSLELEASWWTAVAYETPLYSLDRTASATASALELGRIDRVGR